MHSVVVAQTPLNVVLDSLGRLTSPFMELTPGQLTIDRRRDGEPVLVGEIGDLAYLFDPFWAASFATCWGLLARLARELGTKVMGSTYDPSEEHGEFFLARGSEVVRAFWSNPCRTTRPYSQGDPLPSEANHPLAEAGGRGLTAALDALGFPVLELQDTDWRPGER
jgi:hypothetical protein